MTNNLDFQAVQQKDKREENFNTKSRFDLENEKKFKLVLKEYMYLFGGVNKQGFGQSTFRSFQLAQSHLGLTEEYTNCFYINNFILNQTYIEKSSSLPKGTMPTIYFAILTNAVKIGNFKELLQRLSFDQQMKEYLQEAYIVCQRNNISLESPNAICTKEHLNLVLFTKEMKRPTAKLKMYI